MKTLTDTEIVEYLPNEKQIEITRSIVTNTRNLVENFAEKWYIELCNSSYRYIATYKARIYALSFYQRELHDIVAATTRDEVKIMTIVVLK